MATPGWQRAEDVFVAALTRASELRGAFVDEACGDDAELRRAVLPNHREDAESARRAAAACSR